MALLSEFVACSGRVSGKKVAGKPLRLVYCGPKVMERDEDSDNRRPWVSAGQFSYGGLAGAFFGALSAVSCCWIMEMTASMWIWAAWGGLIGAVPGPILAVLERRNDPVHVNVATHLGALYGLVPGALLFVGAGGAVVNKLSGLLLAGAICAGPMAGLLIGGILDRICEGIIRSRHPKSNGNEDDR
jgi:hypothetical protein